MAIDPNKETPSDVASISSLQSMTEESAKAAMRAGVDGSFGGMKINLLGLLDGLLGGLIEKIKEYLKNPGKILEDGLDLIGSIGGVALGALMALGGGFIDLIKDIGSSIVSLFPGSNPPAKPLPPVYSDIRTNLEGEIKPFVDEFNRQGELVDEAHENIETLQVDYEAQSQRVDQYITDTDAKIEAIGDVDAKIADKATAILEEVEVAQTTAEDGVERAKAINLALTGNTEGNLANAVNDANTAIGAIKATADTAKSNFDNFQVGGRNLLKDTAINWSTDSYLYSGFPLTQNLEQGEIVTISIKGVLPEGRTAWRVFNSGGNVPVANTIPPNNEGIATWTGPWNVGTSNNTHVNIYSARDTSEHTANPGASYVEWLKLERGNKATDWSPAPEDMDETVQKANSADKWTKDNQIAFNNAVSLFTAAQSKVNNVNLINWETQAERNILQGVIDTAQNNSIDALARAVRLAFPDINLLPYSGTRPWWYYGAPWVSTTLTNLPPEDKRSETRSYIVAGSGTQDKNALHAIDLPKDVREFRVRGYVRAASGYFPTVRVLDANNQDLITAWRNTAPRNDDAISENFASGWVSTPNAGGGPMNADSVTDWVLYDQVVRIKDGVEKAWITLTTPSTSDSAYVHGLRMMVFYPVQAEVDFGQQQAINGLKKMIDINNDVTDKLTTITTAQGQQLEMLREIQKTQGEMVMRSMVMNLNSTVSSYLDDDEVFFRVYNNDNNVEVRALNTAGSWVGKAIFTLVFGTQHETAMTQFSIPEGTSRNKVVSTQSRQYRKMARLDWWVYAKVQQRAGSTRLTPIVAPLGWSTLTDHNFTVKTTTDHIIDFSVDWENTTRNGKVYGIRIRRNGTILKELSEKNIGPNFPWESGLRTQSIMWSGNLTAGQNITFEVRTDSDGASAPNDSQRTLGKRSNVITWMEDRKD